jgi:hypothetical protein
MGYLERLIEYIGLKDVSRFLKISPSRIKGYLKGTITVPNRHYKEIYNFYRKFQYRMMRAAGVNTVTARRYQGATPEKVIEVIGRWNRIASYLSREEKVPYDSIISSLARTEYTIEELEMYTTMKGW